MKFAISSDWHGHVPKYNDREVIKSCDCLVLCGDIFESRINRAKMERFLTEINSLGKPIVMTPGNHDWGIFNAEVMNVSNALYGSISKDYLKRTFGINCLIDEMIEVNGVKIYGTPWTPMFCNWAFMLDEEGLRRKYSNIPKGVDILIAHGPPFDENSKIDSCCPNLYTGQPDHLGSHAFRDAIIEKKPKYMFCGHIHSGDHSGVKIGETSCFNVSYLGEDYNPHYPIHILEM